MAAEKSSECQPSPFCCAMPFYCHPRILRAGGEETTLVTQPGTECELVKADEGGQKLAHHETFARSFRSSSRTCGNSRPEADRRTLTTISIEASSLRLFRNTSLIARFIRDRTTASGTAFLAATIPKRPDPPAELRLASTTIYRPKILTGKFPVNCAPPCNLALRGSLARRSFTLPVARAPWLDGR
jgi:hypothetical protein